MQKLGNDMLTVALPVELEAAIVTAAHRSGQSVDEYVATVCADALSLEMDRARLDSYLSGTPAVQHDRVRAWLTELASGNRTECPR
ncbi:MULTISPECIES: hypothetical protein [Burkholderia]|uniref:hypothetical protein n=1 Tax=Burkholderia TaxID=32008 RepID=UPI001CF7C57D|nr:MULTISPECIES: hypothetical protein [Burkholderia]